MTLAVDSNVLFDVLLDDPEHAERSAEMLAAAVEAGPVVVCPVVYAELAAQFDEQNDVDRFLHDLSFRLVAFELPALREAGRAWRNYARRRSAMVQCPQCGKEFDVRCRSCNAVVRWRQHLLPDFLIGGHALTQAEGLLSRDRGYYQTYFPDLRLLPE